MFKKLVKKRRKYKWNPPIKLKKFLRPAAFIFLACLFAAFVVLLFHAADVIIASRKTGQIIKPIVSVVSVNDFEDKMKSVGLDFDSAVISTDGATVTVITPNGTIAYLSTGKDIDWQVNSLQQILNRLTIDNNKPQYVDLRYDKPIVKF